MPSRWEHSRRRRCKTPPFCCILSCQPGLHMFQRSFPSSCSGCRVGLTRAPLHVVTPPLIRSWCRQTSSIRRPTSSNANKDDHTAQDNHLTADSSSWCLLWCYATLYVFGGIFKIWLYFTKHGNSCYKKNINLLIICDTFWLTLRPELYCKT